jgi:hypothetical protein
MEWERRAGMRAPLAFFLIRQVIKAILLTYSFYPFSDERPIKTTDETNSIS